MKPSTKPLLWVLILMIPARFAFAFAAQAVAALVLWVGGDPTPWVSAAGWWTVYGSITDILCLLALVWALRFGAHRGPVL